MTKDELIDLIELMERIQRIADGWLDEPSSRPIMNMVIYLMKCHLGGKLVTPTSLARSAHVPYTTATRRVNEMRNRGLLIFRPRTRSGRSFSVHPSPMLIEQVLAFAVKMRTAVLGTGQSSAGIEKTDAPPVIPPPAIATKALGFGEGLSILLPRDPAYSISRPLQRELAYLMGGKVRFQGERIEDLRKEAMLNAKLPKSCFDVIAVDLPLIGEFAKRGVLMPLDELETDDEINQADFYSAAWRGTSYQNTQYAVPILINPEILFFRKDILGAADLPAPADTRQLLSIAAMLHAPDEQFYGVSWTAAKGAPAGQAFIQFLADFGQPVFNLERAVDGYKTSNFSEDVLRPSIDTERGRFAAAFMRETIRFAPPDILEMSWGDQVDFLREGRIALAYEWASRAAQLTSTASTGELGFLPHPIGVTPIDRRKRRNLAPVGGFCFGIPANIDPDRTQLAWRTIRWLASPPIVKLMVQQGGFVTPRMSVAVDRDVQKLSPVISAIDNMARKGQMRLWPRPPITEFSAVVSALGEEVHEMLKGNQSIDVMLARAQSRAEDILINRSA